MKSTYLFGNWQIVVYRPTYFVMLIFLKYKIYNWLQIHAKLALFFVQFSAVFMEKVGLGRSSEIDFDRPTSTDFEH